MSFSPTQLGTKNGENAARNVVLQAAACVVFAWIATRRPAASLYVWFDVAAVYLLSTLVMGDWLATWIERHTRVAMRRRSLFAVLVFLAMLLAASQGGLRLDDTPMSTSFLALGCVRLVLALVANGAFALLVRGMFQSDSVSAVHAAESTPACSAGVVWAAVVSISIVPQVYASAKVIRLEKQLGEWQAQRQLGRAAQLAERLVHFAPWLEQDGRSITERAASLRARVAELESEVAVPLAENASDSQRLERAQKFAVLDDLESTARTLAPVLLRNRPPAEACLLLATAYEMHANWDASLAWYQRAHADLLQRRGESALLPLMMRSLQGMGYTQRKRGNYRGAEAAYQQLLAFAPSAETHLLLARFYEDAQHSEKASDHARAAMRLAPGAYDAAARELLDHVTTAHFGCMSGLRGDR